MPNIRYRFLAELQNAADTFLNRYHPSSSLPIPIEHIVEVLLGIEVIPVPLLRSKYKIDGYISIDLLTITLDMELMQRFPNRYRFTLAHELGHRELHADQIPALHTTNIEDWKRNMLALHPDTHRRLELQACIFAGFLLVPSGPLNIALNKLNVNGYNSSDQVTNKLASKFAVSREVIRRRIECERSLSLEMNVC